VDDSDLAELPCSILPSLTLRNLVVAMLQARDAVKRRSCSTRMSPRARMPKEVTGKYLVVWEKIGSDWKLASDIWNDGK
jgi:hypothetical protein